LAALRLQTWFSLNLPNFHQFPQSSARITFMLRVFPYIYIYTHTCVTISICTPLIVSHSLTNYAFKNQGLGIGKVVLSQSQRAAR